MALKRRRDHTNMWKEFFNSYFIVIISGLLFLILLVTSEPVCYSPVSKEEHSGYMKRVDCDGGDKICHRFASNEDVTLRALLNSPCVYRKDYSFPHENAYKAITCSTTNLPAVTDGSFDCAPNTDVSMGEACDLTCNGGFYAAYSNQVVCEAGTSHQEGKWSEGSFVCRAIKCSTTNLPPVSEGSFDCAPNSNVSMGEACNLKCNDGFHPAYSSQTVCEAGTTSQEGKWSNGSFVCRFECNDWNEWNGSEYKYISPWQTWENSRQSCESDNSHLVTIENKEENEFVYKMVRHCNQHAWTWIGLNDLNTEGTWEWSDGTVSTYRNWREGEPNGGDAHDCVFMYTYNGKWYDWPCTYGYNAVCERNNPLT